LHQIPAAEGAFLEVALLVAGEVGVVLREVVVRGEEEAAGAALLRIPAKMTGVSG
jgi:hypothetical protein